MVSARRAMSVRLVDSMMFGVLLGGLASLPESVLRGMNLGYKRMGLQAGLSLVGGALTAGALYAGLGLAGVANGAMVLDVGTGTGVVAREAVRLAKPDGTVEAWRVPYLPCARSPPVK